MNSNKEKPGGNEWEILGHEPVPGYRKAFHAVVFLSSIYLLYIFGASFWHG